MKKVRCGWATGWDEKPWGKTMVQYHDEEWGVSAHDDRKHFEFLVLESAQAGLSWSTILNKREGYRKAFAQFDPKKVSQFSSSYVEKLLLDSSIVRNRLKIEAAINNAKHFLKVQKEFGSFDQYIWQFVGGKPKINRWKTMKDLPAKTKESDELSKDLKKRGFRFVGSTIIYAHMQAVGMVNDHTMDCFRYRQLCKNNIGSKL